jgi:SPP1 gp7 family putative phage head morphogenesis protein
MPDNPLSPDFWDEIDDLLWEALGPLAIGTLTAGGEGGAALLASGMENLIDWDGFNQNAIDFLRGYRFDAIRGITETTRDQTQQVLNDWLTSGEPMNVLEARLEPLFGATRASSIAETEVTRIFAQGNEMAWKATGLVRTAIFHTVEDDRVCLMCSPLDGQEFVMGDPDFAIPRHTKCRCWESPGEVSEEMLEQELEGILSE